jgi:hypothetical protein
MGCGAKSLWLIVAPERFGRAPIPLDEMIKAADRATRELRRIFHGVPLKPWQARKGKSGPEIYQFARRRTERREENTF